MMWRVRIVMSDLLRLRVMLLPCCGIAALLPKAQAASSLPLLEWRAHRCVLLYADRYAHLARQVMVSNAFCASAATQVTSMLLCALAVVMAGVVAVAD